MDASIPPIPATYDGFRNRLQAFIAETGPTLATRRAGFRSPEGSDEVAALRRWIAALDEAGYSSGEGASPGLDPFETRILAEELDRAGLPNSIGNPLGRTALRLFGTPEQQSRFLPPLRRGEHLWCQLFSEPDAGSDLASLRTTAVRDGDRYVVNGQKVWTTWAACADYGLLLARTDTTVEKHAGITAFILDMHQPGVEVRPLREITGTSDFSEVFFNDAAVPAAQRIAGDGEGWRVATTTLAEERHVAAAGADDLIGDVAALADLVERTRPGDKGAHQAVAGLHTRARVLQYLSYRSLTREARGEVSIADAPVRKLMFSELYLDVATEALNLLGTDSILAEDEPLATEGGRWADMFLYARAYTIAGGSSEVLRNLLAERALGLPRRTGSGPLTGGDMDFDFSAEQELLRKSTRRLLETEAPLACIRARAAEGPAFDPTVWERGAALGWFGFLVPEALGGGSLEGQGLVDLVVVAEEMGRLLQPGPLVSQSPVTQTLARYGTSEKHELLPGIIAGRSVVSWACAEPGGGWDLPGATGLVARPDRQGYRLTGTKLFVEDADVADALLVTAGVDGQVAQVLVATSSQGIHIRRLGTLDLVRGLCEVTFDAVQVSAHAVVGPIGSAEIVEHQRRIAAVLLCAESAGAAQRVLEFTVDYAKARHQFGRAIGSFQAIKHKLADMLIDVEGITAATYYAALLLDANDEGAAEAVAVAESFVGDAFARLAGEAVQIHGGIGFTWEHDLHLYLRRARTNRVLFGDPMSARRHLFTILKNDASKPDRDLRSPT